MSRPGRFALRVVVLATVAFALMAPAGFGQAASLAGESFETVGIGNETTFGAFTCNANGTTTIPFETNGVAFGPYSGTFTETGTITIGPQTNTALDLRGVGPIVGFQATFTIQSDFPAATVTGTKQLAPDAPTQSGLSAFGLCDPDGSSPPNEVYAIVTDPFILYTAQINATTGSRTDSGTASVEIRSIPTITNPATFQESFNSSEPPLCEDGNNGNGNGSGHQKKNNDNDDDEVCGEDDD